MKKLTFLLALSLIIILSWCWNNSENNGVIDITDTNIEVDVCNEYFELMDCILENDKDEDYTPERRDALRQQIKDMQDSWEWLSDEDVANICSEKLSAFDQIEDRLEEIWCSRK